MFIENDRVSKDYVAYIIFVIMHCDNFGKNYIIDTIII